MLLLLPLAVVLVADQLLKCSVLSSLGEGRAIELGSSMRIRPALSRRTLARRLGMGPILLSFVWLGCLLTILVALHRGGLRGPSVAVALGAALGGAGGNLLDLIGRNGVVDFVELGAWPAFNLADLAIIAGVLIAILAR